MPATATVQAPVGPAKSVTLRTTDDLTRPRRHFRRPARTISMEV